MAFAYDVIQFAVIINLLAGFFSALGFPVNYSHLAICTPEQERALSKDTKCIPRYTGTKGIKGETQSDVFGLFRDSLFDLMRTPFGALMLGLPGMLLVANPPSEPGNPAIMSMIVIMEAVFGLSFFFFILQWARGFGARGAK